MSKGHLFIVSGPSGSGKDTIISDILEKNKNLKLSISTVTRKQRQGEDGDKYNFVSVEKFLQMLANNELLEHNIYCENYYGTPKKPVIDWMNEGFDVLLEIDVNGAEKVRKIMPEAISIFILPPSMKILSERLIHRNTEDLESAKNRIKAAAYEICKAQDYDYIVVNDDIEKAKLDFQAVITALSLTKESQKNILEEVQKDAQSFNWQTD